MKAVFTLTPAESRRLIAKGLARSDRVRAAMERAYVVIAGGTTNGFVAQELCGMEVSPQAFTVGTSSDRILCITRTEARDERIPIVLYKGEPVQKTVKEVFEDFHPESVVIKGANAIDPQGNVGIITSGFDGGTVAKTIGTITSTGMKYIFAVGLEKLVPSVPEAAIWAGAKTFDYSMGAPFGMYCINYGIVFTEIEALGALAGVEAKQLAAGGVGGSEGAVVLAVRGEGPAVEMAVETVLAIKGEPPVPSLRGRCDECPYEACAFHGKKEDELPAWLRS